MHACQQHKNYWFSRLDLIIADFPDPEDTSTARLYSKEFYTLARNRLSENGFLATQSSSIYITPKVFWSINKTLSEVFNTATAYQALVPSFGLWGFNIAGKNDSNIDQDLSTEIEGRELEYINQNTYQNLFDILPESQLVEKDTLRVNNLDNLILTSYYREN